MLKLPRLLSVLGIYAGCFAMGLVFTMVNTTIASIQADLQLPLKAMQWMMMTFGIVNCALLVTSGRLADIYGRKRIFMIGLLSSSLGMTIGGFAESSLFLTIAMVFAGIGNATLLPVSQAMLIREFPKEKRGVATALWASTVTSAMAVGPLAGGMITTLIGWQWVFWINIPIIGFAIAMIALFSNESRNERDPPHLDLKGMVILAITLITFVLITSESSLFTPLQLFMMTAMTALGSYFTWQNKAKEPIIKQELVRNPIFLLASLASGCLVFSLWALFFLLPLYLQKVRLLSPFEAGWMLLGVTLPVVFFSPLVGKWYNNSRGALFIIVGFLFLAAAAFSQLFIDETSSLPVIFLTILPFGVGYALICSPTVTAAISTTCHNRAAIASGTFVTFQEIGGTLGLALAVTAARTSHDLLDGFQWGSAILLLINLMGAIFGALLYRAQSVTQSVST